MVPTRFAAASLWLVLVLFLGSADFAAQQTGRFILPFLSVLMPWVTRAELHAVHLVIRKLVHIAEYAVLALLWFKAIHRVGRRTPRTAGWIALAICLVCAFADELHQSMLPARTGSVRDLVIDALGATAMLMIARWTTEDRQPRIAGAVAAEPD